MFKTTLIALAFLMGSAPAFATTIDMTKDLTSKSDNYSYHVAGLTTSLSKPVTFEFEFSKPTTLTLGTVTDSFSASTGNYQFSLTENAKFNDTYRTSTNNKAPTSISFTEPFALKANVLYEFTVTGLKSAATSFTVNFQTPNAVPLPGAVWLLGTAMLGLISYGRRSAGLKS